jgi:hypothetical protein
MCQGDPKQSVADLDWHPLLGALHHGQLLAEGYIFENQFSMAAQHQRQTANNDNDQLEHGPILAGIRAHFNMDAFWRGTGDRGWSLSEIQLGRVLARVQANLAAFAGRRWTSR